MKRETAGNVDKSVTPPHHNYAAPEFFNPRRKLQ
jgi:hypothetical protein